MRMHLKSRRTCEKCELSFCGVNSVKQFKAHSNSNCNEKNNCDECEEKFTKSEDLKHHLKSIHDIEGSERTWYTLFRDIFQILIKNGINVQNLKIFENQKSFYKIKFSAKIF